MSRWDWYVHGLWILGSLFLFFGALLAGNLSWIEGTNEVSFTLAVVISFLLILVGGLMWISAAINGVQHELDPPEDRGREVRVVKVYPEPSPSFRRSHPQEEAPRTRINGFARSENPGKVKHYFVGRKNGYIKF